jgi:polysaccharide biosynthesis protein PslH
LTQPNASSMLPPQILFITFGLPFPPHRGARLRNFHLIRQAARIFRTRIIALVEPHDDLSNIGKLSRFCQKVETVAAPQGIWKQSAALLFGGIHPGRPLATAFFYSPELASKIRQAVQQEDVRLIQIEHSILAPHIEAVPESKPITKVLSFHNLAANQYRSMLKMDGSPIRRATGYAKYLLMNKWEARIAARFDHCVTVSEKERDALVASNPHLSVSVIKNGVDTTQISFLPPAGRKDTLLFVGNLRYAPNQDAIHFLCREILPKLRSEFPKLDCTVAGAAPDTKLVDFCQVHGVKLVADPQELAPLYQEAAICIVPLRSGGGTRLKILEAMAYGRPIVSTPFGGEGLDVSGEQNILWGATADEFAGQVSRLIQSAELAERLARNARDLVERNYDWQQIGIRQHALYDSLLQIQRS